MGGGKKLGKGARDFLRWKSCERKVRFDSKAAAYQKGQDVYRCHHCGGWHRTGALSKLISQVGRHGKR